MQVGFIGGICLPCYDLLVQVLPATGPMQQNCKDNLNTWKDKADERRREMAALEAKIAEENSKEKGKYTKTKKISNHLPYSPYKMTTFGK